MAPQIRDAAYHRAEIAKDKAANTRRLDRDVMDVGLSFWATSQMIEFHEFALEALELGAANGMDGPAAKFLRLKEGKRIVDAQRRRGDYGYYWHLAPAEQKRFGLEKPFLPAGARSRKQKALGVSEGEVVLPCTRVPERSCAGLGCPIIYTAKAA